MEKQIGKRQIEIIVAEPKISKPFLTKLDGKILDKLGRELGRVYFIYTKTGTIVVNYSLNVRHAQPWVYLLNGRTYSSLNEVIGLNEAIGGLRQEANKLAGGLNG